eukprot:358440-Chlamydomonas_euryale.AAC.2
MAVAAAAARVVLRSTVPVVLRGGVPLASVFIAIIVGFVALVWKKHIRTRARRTRAMPRTALSRSDGGGGSGDGSGRRRRGVPGGGTPTRRGAAWGATRAAQLVCKCGHREVWLGDAQLLLHLRGRVARKERRRCSGAAGKRVVRSRNPSPRAEEASPVIVVVAVGLVSIYAAVCDDLLV